jgi:murein DD-endopeptidase MepM/ murein hydrolase activator NlpD
MRITKRTTIRYALAAAAVVAGTVTVGASVPDGSTDHLTAVAGPVATPSEDLRAQAQAEARLHAQQLATAAETARARKADAARKAAAVRAARSKARATAARKAAAAAKAAAAKKARSWIRPMRGDLTSGFGYRWGTSHEGVDIANGGGTPVYAAASGVVAEARCTSPSCSHPGGMGMSGYGNKVDITHAGGIMTRYGHLRSFVVRTGQRVTAGQLIGYEGATGNVTGPHLHLEVHRGAQAVDPIRFFSTKGINLRVG